MENPNFSWSASTPLGLVAALQSFIDTFEKSNADYAKAIEKGVMEAAYFMGWNGTTLIRQATYASLATKLLASRDLADPYWNQDLNITWARRHEDTPESIKGWMLAVCSEAERSCRIRYMPASTSDASNIVELAQRSFWSNLYEAMDLELRAELLNKQVEFRNEERAKGVAQREAEEKARADAVIAKEAEKKARRAERRAARKAGV